jgi:hypothetical protein
MKVPINPIVEMALKYVDDENCISHKISKLSTYCIEYKQLRNKMLICNPTVYMKTRMEFLVENIVKLHKEIQEWENNCSYKAVSI